MKKGKEKELEKDLGKELEPIEVAILLLFTYITMIILCFFLETAGFKFKNDSHFRIMLVVSFSIIVAIIFTVFGPKLSNSKFGWFIRKYHVSKKIWYIFLTLFVLQHSMLTKAPQCWVPIKEKDVRSNRENVIADFDYRSLCNNYCLFHKEVLRHEYPYCSTQIIMQTRLAKPHFIDCEKLYLEGALKDFRTIFLLGFLFDYDKLYESLPSNLK